MTPRPKLPPFDPAWLALSFAFAPTVEDCQRMLAAIRATVLRDGDAASLLGVPRRTFKQWQAGHVQSYPVRALIFTRWALLCHPEKIQSAFDLVTWGRFRTIEKRPVVRIRTAGFTDGDGI